MNNINFDNKKLTVVVGLPNGSQQTHDDAESLTISNNVVIINFKNGRQYITDLTNVLIITEDL